MARHKSSREPEGDVSEQASQDKGKYIPLEKRQPFDPENGRISKEKFLEKQRLAKAKELRLREMSREIDEEQKNKK